MSDDAPDESVQAGAHAWLLAQWAARGVERPPRCPVCGVVALPSDTAGYTPAPHDPVAHGWAAPDPTIRDPSPTALRRLAEYLGERDDD